MLQKVKYLKVAVLLIGPLPPPFGGQAILVDQILGTDLAKRVRMRFLNVSHSHPGFLMRLLLCSKFSACLVKNFLTIWEIGIVHTHSSAGLAFFEKSLFVLVAKAFGKKSILHLHGGKFRSFWDRSGKIRRQIIRFLLNRNDRLIVLSSGWANFYRDTIGCKTQIEVLPNAVYMKSVLLESPRMHPYLTFLFVGHLKREKGLLDILEALRRLPVDVASMVSMRIMGEGDTREEELFVKDAFSRSGLSNVSFLGPMAGREKWGEFAAADVFLLPSYSEDLPISILEAMACGLPVITTPVGSIPDIVGDGINGFFVPPGDPESLKECILRMVSDAPLRNKMGQANREKISTDYSFTTYEETLSRIYADVLET